MSPSKESAPPNGVHVHRLVTNLRVTAAWPIGRATIREPGWLADELDLVISRRPKGDMKTTGEFWRRSLEAANTSSITVPVQTTDEPEAGYMKRAAAEALGPARDALAVLSLFQRSRSNTDMSLFQFGLEVELFRASTMAWATQADGSVFTDWSLTGGQFPFELTEVDQRTFHADPRFAFLNQALLARSPTEWQRRAIVACRVLRLATSEPNPQTRVLLSVVALEALLGDPHIRGGAGTGRHQLARRACFVWCGAEFGDPHGPNRAACPYLLAATGKELGLLQGNGSTGSGPTRCSYYGEILELLAVRGSVAHGGEAADLSLVTSRASSYAVEQILMGVLGWAVQTGATEFGEYETAIKALPLPE